MNNLLRQIAECIEKGKIDANSPYPPDMKGEIGVVELTRKAISESVPIKEILDNALIKGMRTVGERFERGEAYIPNLLISAKAMNAAMEQIKPLFEKNNVQTKGKVILGTVLGDLHDIGKNIVKMILEGNGWEVIDLGIDVPAEKFLEAIDKNDTAAVGLSALLTSTMLNMENIVKTIKGRNKNTKVFVGGAPVSQEFSNKIGADGFFAEPNSFVKHLLSGETD